MSSELFRLWLLALFGTKIDAYLTVHTTSGPVRGQLLKTVIDQLPYYSFKGIPYAEPPSASRRFLPPIPRIHRWRTPRDCFQFGSVCLQFDPTNQTQIIGDEDCLFLNVYVPAKVDYDSAEAVLKPVMVYIHGGGFFFGSGNDDLQGPDVLIDEDVILITINYRIGVLGFLSLGTAEYSGNQGLKDQQLALTWIKANVRQFGGDANRITIFGQSAGSASCVFHMMAPGSRGLFHQSIQMSSTFDVWSIFERGDHLDDIYQLAQEQQYSITHYSDLVQFISSVDPHTIVGSFPIVQYHPDRSPITITSKWLPVVENSRALQPFMQSTPTQMLLMDSFDLTANVMMGYTTAESLFYNTQDCLHPELLNAFDQHFAIELPSIHFDRNYSSPGYKEVAAKIRQHYFPNRIRVNANHATLQRFVQLMSHVYQNYPIDQRARLFAKQTLGNVFFYRFGLISELNYYKNKNSAQQQFGASHADDLCYVFHCSLIRQAYQLGAESREYGYMKQMVRLYTSFAKYSNPMPGRLEPVSWDVLNYVDITAEGLAVGVNPLAEVMAFWTRLMSEHRELFGRDVDRFVDHVLREGSRWISLQ